MNIQKHKEIEIWKTNRHDARSLDGVQVGTETKERNNKKQNTNHTIQGDTTMSTNSMFSRISIVLFAVLMLSSMQQAFATGTLAGTTISNTASVTYNDGANVKIKNSNTLSLVVGHKVVASFSPSSGSISTYDNVTYYYPVHLVNGSNRSTLYNISFTTPSNYTLSLVADDNNDGIHQSGETTVVGSGTGYVDVDASKYYFLKAVLGTITNGTVDTAKVTFTNASTDSGSVIVVNPTASFTFSVASTITKPVLSYSVSGSAPSASIPGAAYDYTITLDNTGTAAPYSFDNGVSATPKVQLVYTVPSNFAFTGGASGTFTLSAYGTASYTYSAPTLTIQIDTADLVPANTAFSFTVPTIIEQTSNNGTGPASGASIVTASGDFGDLSYGNAQTVLTLTPSTSGTIFNGAGSVATSKGGKYTLTPANANASAGETVEYIFHVKNMGNAASTFNLTDMYISGLDTNHLIALTTYGADLGVGATGSVIAGDSINIYVRLTVPALATNGQTIARKITVLSNASGTVYTGAVNSDSTFTVTTSVIAATFTINLSAESIVGTGTTSNPAPGDEITFLLSITNTGASTATSVVISNLIPTNMTFDANGFASGYGITIDAVNQTNGNDGDDAWYDATGNGTVKTNSTFSVAASTTKEIRYKCIVN
jgi:uncharacterized repeat protein (TIGR01451 family)